MTDRDSVPPELLRQLIRFEPETGKYFWNPRARDMFEREESFKTWNTRYANKETLNNVNKKSGYFQVTVSGIRFMAHRVIWAYHHGYWPNDDLDHINGIKTDNRIENLRIVDAVENGRNRRISRNNKSGKSGVHWNNRQSKWLAIITVNFKKIYLGTFSKIDDAILAREQAEADYGFHENHGKQPMEAKG